jgi:tetratricopeptide (TPR) repeat protein/AraC-like DNA-binding protein
MTEPLPVDQIFIRKLTEIIIANLGNENFGVNELARASGVSLYNLSRRLHSINKKTVNQFIREIRLQKALEMLQNEEYSASEVAYKVGFGSPAYFNKCFHEFFGYPPGKIKKRDLSDNEPQILTQSADENKPGKSPGRTYLLSFSGILLIVLVLVTVVILIYKKIQKSDNADNLISSDGRISIAVMPFQNMTNDTIWDVWQDAIQNELINYLTNSEELKVRQAESITGLLQSKGITNYASITPSVASTISQKLDAKTFIYGSIKQAGDIVRVNAQLINSKTDESIKSFQIDGTSEKEIMHMIDSLKVMVKNFLLISELKKKRSPDERHFESTNSPEAYRYYIYGDKAYSKLDFSTAIDWCSKAIAIDSNFTFAAYKMSWAYRNLGMFDQARQLFLKLYKKRDMMSIYMQIELNWAYSNYFETPYESLKYLKQFQDLDDQLNIHYALGVNHLSLNQYDKAIPEFEKNLEINNKRGIKPWLWDYAWLGFAYHKTGQYKKEKKLYRKAEKYFPEDPELMDQEAWVELSLGDTVTANRYLEKWKSIRKEQSWPEVRIAGYMAYIYSIANIPEKEEECYRKALSLEPEMPDRLNDLAYFLIDKDRNINEGMELIDSALRESPDDYSYLHTKGWGLCKQGRYQEAKKTLQKSWDLRRQNSVYDHTAYLHLEEASKAAAGQK